MNEVYQFNLLTIARIIKKRRTFILLCTLIAALAGFTFSMLKPARYEAKTEFFLQNPFYADRNFIFNYETKFIDYFATDDEVNRLMTLSQSDIVLKQLIDSFNLAAVYDFDTTDYKENIALRSYVADNVEILRTDKRTVSLSYTDKDPSRAASIANAYAFFLEKTLREVYNTLRWNMHESVMAKASEEDSLIQRLTDSLAALRDQYGIYDLINPARYSFVLTPIKPNGKEGFAEGLEKIQNVAALKDELVKNMAGHLTLKNQYTTGTGEEQMKLTHIITKAREPLEPKGPGKLIILISCAALGFLFSVCILLLNDFYGHLKTNI